MMDNDNKLTVILENLAGGGAERNLTNLMNYLVDDGWEIDLVLVKKEPTTSSAFLFGLDKFDHIACCSYWSD